MMALLESERVENGGGPRHDDDVARTRLEDESDDGRGRGESCYESDSDSSYSSSESVFSSVMSEHDKSDAVSELGSSLGFGNSESLIAGMDISNALGMSSAPTYPDGEYEDDKADMIAKLMKNHANVVTSSLVGRSNLIQSVTWLSHHVPGCVLKSLLESIMRARKRRAHVERRQQRHAKRPSDACTDKENEETAEVKARSQSFHTRVSLNSSISPMGLTSVSPSPPFIREDVLPFTKNHDSALLFVDISGFTKISVMMDVESLSNAINSYFQKLVNEIRSHGGDILKFAGDALFAEWKVSCHKPDHNLEYCVSRAANCGAAIVANCSDYAVVSKPIGFDMSSRRTSLVSRNSIISQSGESTEGESGSRQSFHRRPSVDIIGESTVGESEGPKSFSRRASVNRTMGRTNLSSEAVTLNVKCGVGVGHIVGIHVGDDISRREYLILGDPISQVAKAEAAASQGEVYASPEAVQLLVRVGHLTGDWEEAVKDGKPMQIANRNGRFFEEKERRLSHRESSMSCEAKEMLHLCDDLNSIELQWLKRTISLYVHPVVVNDDNERATPMRRRSNQERHLAEAELRNVYTCFITPLIDYKLSGDKGKDEKLFSLLNNIMNLTTRELDRMQGHLRQFILDDKGLVLICTFGLRGSTFPNMIAQRAVPFSLSIHKSLEEELGVKSTIGATFGKVYCGVVGGLERHEFAALGPSVNLAARLMASKGNPGILVDKNVRLLTSQVYFKPLPPVKAKGYDEPVPIFEPMTNAAENKWGQAEKNFVGRANEIKQIMRVAKSVVNNSPVSKLLLVEAMSGTGKSTLMVQATEHVKAMIKKMNRKVIVTRNISNEGDSRIPFSLFRTIFRDVLTQVRHEDVESQTSMSKDGSRQNLSSDLTDFSIDAQWENLSIQSQSSKGSTMSTDATRFRFICQELNAPPDFIEVVGKRLLGLRERSGDNSAANVKPLNLHKIVDFMADAFIRCTKHANLVLLGIDDVQWMDEMSWKVVQAIFERGENVMTLCGSRPLSSNPLTVDPTFWSDLQGQYQKEGRYSELILAPFSESEVQRMIATTLELEADEIDSSFSRNILTTSGGMPHYLTYVLDAIKRNKLTVRLENGMVGMKSSSGNNNKLGFGSVREIHLYRIDALDSSVRTVLHLSAVLGTEFDLLDAALAYEEMFGVEDSKRLETATAFRDSFDVAIEEGIIIEQSFTFSEDDGDAEIMDEEDNLCTSMGNIMISLKGRKKAHPFYTDNRRLRFTHDSWKTSILNIMLDERKQEMHEHVAMSLERELDDEAHAQDDFEKQIRVFKHWKACGNFPKAAVLCLKIGGQLMLLGLNSQAILLFDDVLDILKEMTDDELDITQHGGISAAVLDAIEPPELENLIKLLIAKGKSNCTLAQYENGGNAYQTALDASRHASTSTLSSFLRKMSLTHFFLFSFSFVRFCRYLITHLVRTMRNLIEVCPFQSLVVYLLS